MKWEGRRSIARLSMSVCLGYSGEVRRLETHLVNGGRDRLA
jgi:hypothetical protein